MDNANRKVIIEMDLFADVNLMVKNKVTCESKFTVSYLPKNNFLKFVSLKFRY
jgi:hypothetical protein